jgi:hypothetical protein
MGLQMSQHGWSLQYFSTICSSRVSVCTAADYNIHRYKIATGPLIYPRNNVGSCVYCDLADGILWQRDVTFCTALYVTMFMSVLTSVAYLVLSFLLCVFLFPLSVLCYLKSNAWYYHHARPTSKFRIVALVAYLTIIRHLIWHRPFHVWQPTANQLSVDASINTSHWYSQGCWNIQQEISVYQINVQVSRSIF